MKITAASLEQRKNLCELWDEELVQSKPHSRLHCLEPIGMGTPMVESLTSYVTRLAEAHCVYPRMLFTNEIAPLLRQTPLYNKEEHTAIQVFEDYWFLSPRLNGPTTSASNLIQALEQLTMRNDLRFLTLSAWHKILPSAKLLRKVSAWCPACYEDWRKSNQIVYTPLLWAMASNQICAYHQLPLQTHCPAAECGRSMFPLSRNAQPGYCAHCYRWLGDPAQYKDSLAMPEDGGRQWAQWIANVLGEFLATAPNLPMTPSRDQFTTTIAHYVDGFSGGSKEGFGRHNHLSTDLVTQWVNRHKVPQMENLLQLCFYTGTSLVDFLVGKVPEFASKESGESLGRPCEKQPGKRRRFNSEEVLYDLKKVLRDTEGQSPSLWKVAREVGYDHSLLKNHFPDLAQAISSAHRGAVKQQHAQKQNRRLENARLEQERKLALASTQATLEAVLEATESNPVPLREIIKRSGLSEKLLRKRYPELCKAVAARYKAFKKHRSSMRMQQVYDNLKEVMVELHKQGRYPGTGPINKLLRTPGVFRNPAVRAVHQQILRELGWVV